jgi:4-hydroxy-tetrahydrodipicolinate synthase
LGLYAKDAGVNALMIVTPYYVKPTQQGLIDYYKKLDQTLDMPILLYNIPHKTGVNMLPTTVETIVNETSNVVGMKECTENFGQMVELINLVGDKITVLAGEEFVAVASMIFGAKGAVMASANVMPRLWIKLYELIRNGEKEKAIEVNKEYNSVFKTIFMEGNPGPLKAAMNMTGLSAGSVSTPLLSPTTETVNELTQVMKYLKLYV